MMKDVTPGMIFSDILRSGTPDATAWIRGNAQNLVSFVKKNGAFAEVVSEDEYLLARRLGYENWEIIYNGQQKPKRPLISPIVVSPGHIFSRSKFARMPTEKVCSGYSEASLDNI